MKLTRNLSIATILLSTLTLSGCISSTLNGKNIRISKNRIVSSGNVVTKTLNFGEVTRIKLDGLQDVFVTQGNRQKIEVRASDNVMKYGDFRYDNGELTISVLNGKDNLQDFDMEVYITVRTLDNIVSSGTGDIEFRGTFRTPTLSMKLNGTGDIDIPALECDFLTSILNGTGDISLYGTCETAKLQLNGTGDIKAQLSCRSDVNASLTGTGDIRLSGTTHSARYSDSGTGDIYARNMRAEDVRASATGTGDITCHASQSFTGKTTSITHITCYGKPKNKDLSTEHYSFPD